MATIDARNATNNVALNVELGSDAVNHTVHLDFISEYDQQVTSRDLDVNVFPEWLVGTLPNSEIPPTDNYRLEVYDTEADFLPLNHIFTPLNVLNMPLNNIRGASRSVLLKTLRAIVIGNDLPATTENLAENIQITQPIMVDQNITQPAASSAAITQPAAIDSNITQSAAQNTMKITRR